MITERWSKATACSLGNCVKVRLYQGKVEVSDSAGAIVMYTPTEWRTFVAAVKNGEFDLPDEAAA